MFSKAVLCVNSTHCCKWRSGLPHHKSTSCGEGDDAGNPDGKIPKLLQRSWVACALKTCMAHVPADLQEQGICSVYEYWIYSIKPDPFPTLLFPEHTN